MVTSKNKIWKYKRESSNSNVKKWILLVVGHCLSTKTVLQFFRPWWKSRLIIFYSFPCFFKDYKTGYSVKHVQQDCGVQFSAPRILRGSGTTDSTLHCISDAVLGNYYRELPHNLFSHLRPSSTHPHVLLSDELGHTGPWTSFNHCSQIYDQFPPKYQAHFLFRMCCPSLLVFILYIIWFLPPDSNGIWPVSPFAILYIMKW